MATKKNVEPKTDTKKVEAKDPKATKKVERKTQAARWSDAGIKYAVTPLG